MKCSKCGKESKQLMAGHDLSTGENRNLCPRCLIRQYPVDQNVTAIDEQLEEANELVKLYGIFSEKNKGADYSHIPEEMAPFMITPRSGHSALKKMRDELLALRENKLAEMTEKELLVYRINRAVKIEDYEEADRLHGKLVKLE